MDLSTQVLPPNSRQNLSLFPPSQHGNTNPEEAYSNLLKQQTQFLNKQFGIPVMGLGLELHQILPSYNTLRNVFLSTHLFTSIK
jgi:hypothetical protein